MNLWVKKKLQKLSPIATALLLSLSSAWAAYGQVVNSTVAPMSRTVSSLGALSAGTVVAIRSVYNGKYVQLGGGEAPNWIAATAATTEGDAKTLFTILRKGDLIGFATADGNNLNSPPQGQDSMFTIKSDTKSFGYPGGWENFTVSFDGNIAYIKSEITTGLWNVNPADANGFMRTHKFPWDGSTPATKDNSPTTTQFYIEIMSNPIAEITPGSIIRIKSSNGSYVCLGRDSLGYMFSANGSLDQATPFTVTKNSDGSYNLGNMTSLPYINFGDGYAYNYAVWSDGAKADNSQSWKVSRGDDGIFRFMNVNTGGYLNTQGSAYFGGSGLRTCKEDGSAAMTDAKALSTQFTIEKVLASGATAPHMPILLPEGFEEEVGATESIAVGSRNGELEAWCVALDKASLYRYDAYSMNPNPWIKVEAKDQNGVAITSIDEVSVSSDGDLWILDNTGNAYQYNWDKNNFKNIPAPAGVSLDQISAGSKNDIWACDIDSHTLYEFEDGKWVARAEGVGSFVAAGLDSTVVSINLDGNVFRYDDAKGHWLDIPGQKLDQVAVGSKDVMYGIYKNQLFMFNKEQGIFQALKDKQGNPVFKVSEVSVNAAGTVFLTDLEGDIYNKGEAGVDVKKAPTEVKVPGQAIKVTEGEKVAGKKSVEGVKTKKKDKVVEIKAAKKNVGKKTRKQAIKEGIIPKNSIKGAKVQQKSEKVKINKAKKDGKIKPKKSDVKKNKIKKEKVKISKQAAKVTAAKKTAKVSAAKKTAKVSVAKKTAKVSAAKKDKVAGKKDKSTTKKSVKTIE